MVRSFCMARRGRGPRNLQMGAAVADQQEAAISFGRRFILTIHDRIVVGPTEPDPTYLAAARVLRVRR